MSMINEQVLRSELGYRTERALGREGEWARVEGRRGVTLRRWRRRGTPRTAGD